MNYPAKLSEHIFLLGNHYFPTYLIRGDRCSILIESGISFTANQVVDQIKTLGLVPADIEKLLITHAHADHVAGAPVLKKAMPGLDVTSSVETARLLKKAKVREVFYKDDFDIARELKRLGQDGEDEDICGSLGDLIDETICPGQVLDLGGVALEIIDAPGHCLGGLAFWEPDEKVLFCSDYLGFFVPPDQVVPNFYVNYKDFMATYTSLTSLHPSWICPGHCGAYSGKDAVEFMNRSKRELDWIYHRILAHDRSSDLGDRQLLTELYHRYYVREATIFSEEGTRYCMSLLTRRILDANGLLDAKKHGIDSENMK